MKQRLEYIDIAKGFTIIMVVMGHIVLWDMKGASQVKVLNFIDSFQMPTFMLLSGYVLALGSFPPKYGFWGTAIRKFRQLVIPFLIWGIFITPFILKRIDIPSYPQYLKTWLLHPDNGLWFLISLFEIQIAFSISRFISNRLTKCNSKIIDLVTVAITLLFPVAWKVCYEQLVSESDWGG